MLLRMVYDDKLAQAAYLIGCQRTGEAIIVDPQRDVDRYINLAGAEGLRLTAAAETHIHADFLSGSRELAEHAGVRVYLSGEGGEDWQYQWHEKKSGGGSYAITWLRDGSRFSVGNIDFRVLHTPGHTPEHVCFLVTDRGGGATEPMGMLSGDFVFVGDVGRPDLLETAAGVKGSKEAGAHDLFRSIRKTDALPDYVQIWPGHGAGSACGKALGAVPQTTLGYERRFNPAWKAASSPEAFAAWVLHGQPDPPLYFARMKVQNKEGPRVLGAVPVPRQLDVAQLASLDFSRVVVLDPRPKKEFMQAHLPGSLFAPLDTMFPMVAGSFVAEDDEVVIVGEETTARAVARDLCRIGIDRVRGFVTPEAVRAAIAGDAPRESTREVECLGAQRMLAAGDVTVIDVRAAWEHVEGRVPGAINIPYTRLAARIDSLDRRRDILVHCKSGGRSARACAFLQRRGFKAVNLDGGMMAWEKNRMPIEK
ncbi:MAG: rhodanese-like domain-containing protein [Planctomycetota bacterium]|nr:rhodanese-like domain-containing protein [Planctomycetota bacterium]